MLKYAKICQLCSLHLKNQMPGNLIKSRVFGIYWHFEIGKIYGTNTFHLPRHSSFTINHTFANLGMVRHNMPESLVITTILTTKAHRGNSRIVGEIGHIP